MAANLCALVTQSGSSCNAISIRLRKDWDEYLLNRLRKITLVPPSSVVIKEIIESPADSKSPDSGKRQAPLAIEGFTPLVLALPAVIGLASSSVQEGTTIVLAIRGFNPLILPKPALGTSRVSSSKALKAMLPSLMVINPKTFSITPNLQT